MDPVTLRPARRLRGDLAVPGDKSISHRALLLGGLASGRTTIHNFLDGEDCLATLACLRALGVQAERPAPAEVIVHGQGHAGLREPEDVLDARNSGTTTRLLSGILASVPFFSVLTGDGSLRRRDQSRIVLPLRRMGAAVEGRSGGSRAPLAIRGGGLTGIDYAMPQASAQVKSCLLLAGLQAASPTTVREPAATRDHTERMLRAMGARIEVDGPAVTVHPLAAPLQAASITVPADTSSAAFWMVAAAIHPDAEITLRAVGMNPTRTGIIGVLQRMGADVRTSNPGVQGGEPVADVTVRSSDLGGATVEPAEIASLIDEFPVLAVAALAARGTVSVRDAGELRAKESDRIAAIARLVAGFGGRIEVEGDDFRITGTGRMTGTVFDPQGDHRLAMAAAVAGLVAEGETTVLGPGCAAVSYPSFWEDLQALVQ